MVNIRPAKLEDIKQIQEIEKEYYEGFNCPEETLKNWIQNLSENFIVAEENNRIVGFIFFEYLNKIKAIPFVHHFENNKNRKYAYISEVGILDRYIPSEVLQELFNKLLEKAKKDECKSLIWLTGSKSKHDKVESNILLNNNFSKKENIKHWEAYPNFFIDDHYIWLKQIERFK